MDQNVIRLTKLHYRTSLLSSIVAQEDVPVSVVIKELTLLDAVRNFVAAWDRIEENMIVKCWKPIQEIVDETVYDSEDELPLANFRNTDDQKPTTSYFHEPI